MTEFKDLTRIMTAKGELGKVLTPDGKQVWPVETILWQGSWALGYGVSPLLTLSGVSSGSLLLKFNKTIYSATYGQATHGNPGDSAPLVVKNGMIVLPVALITAYQKYVFAKTSTNSDQAWIDIWLKDGSIAFWGAGSSLGLVLTTIYGI